MRRGRRRWAGLLAGALLIAPVVMVPTPASAGGGTSGGSGHDGGQHGPGSSDCDVYPIAVKSAVLTSVHQGKEIDDLTAGTPSGHEGWLTWTGDIGEPVLSASLTPPGNSARYIDPDDPADRLLSVGDWVRGRPGTVSGAGVRSALDKLIGERIVVPVWDATRGTGSGVAYHVSGFAAVEITSYRLNFINKISAKYLGPSTCITPEKGPAGEATKAATAEDHPVTITLQGTATKTRSGSGLTFALAAPSHGTVNLAGMPSCWASGHDSHWPWWPSFAVRRFDSSGQSGGHDPRHGGDDDDEITCRTKANYTPAADYFGPDAFTFTVSDGRTTSTPATVSISVSEVNDRPVAGADSAAAGGGPLLLPVSELLANDTPGPANESGQKLTVTSVAAWSGTHGTVTLAGGTVRYVADPGFTGVATFTYTVCDNGTTAGRPAPLCAKAVVSVTVTTSANRPPVAAPAEVAAVEDTALPITLGGSDPDGDPLSFAVVSGPSHGTLSGVAPALTYAPAADYFGPDELSFTVSDGHAGSLPATVKITVGEVNDPPIAGADSASGSAGQTVTLAVTAVLANDVPGPANEAGQILSVTAVAPGADTHGTVSLDAGAITYIPDTGFSGTATFTYTLCDDGTTAGQADPLCTPTGTVTVNLGAPNLPPVADPSSVEAIEDTPVPVTLTGSDPDGDPLVFAAAGPGNGTLSGTAPNLTYTPAANFFGPDTFTFTVSDGQATSVPATVSVTVSEVNDPPIAGADSQSAPGHQPTAISAASLLANDVPGPSNEATQTLAVTAATAGPDTHGTVALARGTITYVPDPGYAGPASFTYTVCDNGTTGGQPDPLCVDATVSLTVAPATNAVPVGQPAVVDAAEDTPLPITLAGDDADGDPLTFAVASAPAHGTLTGTAPDLTYTPSADYFGQDQLSFTVFDGQATSVPVTLTIAVSEVNDPPVAGADAVTVTNVGPSTLDPATLLVNDVAGPANESGQVLTLTAVTAGAGTHGTVTLVDGTITYTPDAGFDGTASFTYTVCDNGTTSSLADPRCTTGGIVTVEVVTPDQPPVAGPQSLTVAEDNPLPVVLSGSDPENDPLIFRVAAGPAHGSISGTAPQLTYTPAADYFGPDSFTFVANDGATDSAPATVTINVTEVNDPPVLHANDYTLGGGGVLPPPPPAPQCGTPCGVIFGDPHLLTFDGAAYDAQAVGEVIAAKSTTDDFEVQARFTAVPGSRTVSIDTALAMRVAGHRVTLYRTQTGIDARIDGNTLTVPAFPQALPGGGTIGTYGLDDTIIVVWPDGSLAIVRAVGVFPEYYRFTVDLGIAPARLGHVVGLLGGADGDKLNDLVTRSGQAVAFPDTPFNVLYGTYVNSWRIGNAESMFDYGPGQTTETFTDLTYPDAPVTPATLPAAARTSATTTCNLFGLTTPELLDACIVDVGTTGDPDFATGAAEAQESGLGIPTNAGSTTIGTSNTVVTTVAGENAVRTFPATAGQKVTLQISGSTFTAADVTIRSSTGTVVLSQLFSTPTGFRDVFTLPSTGTYSITVDPRLQQVGTLTFVLGAVADNSGPTAIGTPTTVTTTTIGENALRTFDVAAGQKLTMTVSASSFSGGADFFVRRPDGSSVTSLFLSAATGFRDVFTLASGGTYTMVVDPRDQQTGTATYLLAAVPDNTGSTAIGTPTTVTTTVIGENALRTFDVAAGQKLTLTVSANSFSGGADFFVRRPDGSSAASLFLSAATGFRDVFTLVDAGTYTMVVDPRDQQTGTATYLLAAVPDNTGTTTIGTPTTVTTTVIGENAERTFSATAGQRLTLTVSANSFSGGADFFVRRPDGSSAASLFLSAATGFRDVFTLASAGTYTMVVDPRDQQTGTATFVLAAVPDNTGITAIGSPTTVTTTVIGENAERTFSATAGQRLTLTVSANSFSGGADFFVRRPDGSSAASLFLSAATGFRDVFTLVDAGTYTMVVDPRDQQTGTATYLLAAVPDNTGTTTIGTPTTVTTTVIGENAERTFTGTTGQRLTFTVSGNTYSGGADFTVRRSDRTSVASLFVSATTGFRNVFTLPAAGTYTMEVDPRDQQTGTATFLLADAPAGVAAAVSRSTALDPLELAFIHRSRVSAPQTAGIAATAAPAAAAAAAVPTLTITVAQLLANVRPGPDNEVGQTSTVTAVASGPFTHGTVTFAAGVVSYTPDADFVGNASFPYTVCDDGTTNGQPDPRCTTGAINVKVTVNHPPVIDAQTVTTSEDTPVAVTLTGRDPEGQSITFVPGAPGRGTLIGVPPALTYTPAPDANGADSFTFTANDGSDQSTAATVAITITEVNDPPVPQPDSATARAGQTIVVPAATLTANDAGGPFDERLQTLTVTAVTPGPDTHGTVTLAGGNVTFVPEAGFAGTAVIGETVCDNGTTNGAADPRCADSTLSITANRPPVANDGTVQTSLTEPVAAVLSASDPDADPLTFAIVDPPQHGTLTGTAPNLTYTATAGFVGGDSFTFTASDAYGTSAPAIVSITVRDIPSPTLVADSATVRAGQSVVVDVLGNDTPGSGTFDLTTLAIGAAPTKGTAAVEAGRIRYTATAGASGTDALTYNVCDTGGGCGTATVTVTITDNHAPTATDDSYDIAAGTTLHPAAPGVLGNDTDPDAGDKLQVRLVTGVGNGRLLLNSTGAFTYTPNGPGVDTFTYHVLDSTGAVSNEATVTIYVTGPAGPPVVGNDLYQVQQGRELDVAGPGVLTNDYSPNPRLGLTVALLRDAAKGTLLLQPDGSFVYTPLPGYTGIDQFSYTVRDSEGRVSAEGRVGITVTASGPPTATVGSTSPPDGAVVLGPTHFTAALVPPAGETVTSWSVSYRRPGSPVLVPLATGSGPSVAADFDPTLVRNGTYEIVIRAVTSGGGVLVSETGLGVEGEYKPGWYRTTFRDVAVNSANIPIELLRTYDSTDRSADELGAGWSLELANFRVDSNGPLGGGPWTHFTCGSFPFLSTCYQSSKPHFVTVTWPDGHVERFRFVPDQGSQLVPTLTTAGFVAEPGTTSTLTPVGNGLLLSGSDFLLGDFFSSDGIYDPIQFVLTDKSGTKYTLDKRAGLLGITDRNGNTVSIGSDGVDSSSGLSMTFVRDAENRITTVVGPTGNVTYRYSPAGDLVEVDYPDGTSQNLTYDGAHNLLTVSGGGQLVRTVQYDAAGRVTAITDGNGHTATVSADVAGHQEVTTDATGRLTTVLTLDQRGNVIRRDATFDGRTVTTSATFDALGRQLSATDANGHTSSTTYDADGNVLTQTDGNGHTTRYTYNQLGEVLTVTDPTLRVTSYTYDVQGNLTAQVAPGGAATTYTYDNRGRLLSKTDAAGTTTYTNDAAGYPASATDPAGGTVREVVDPATGWVTSHTDAEGTITTYEYDSTGLVTKITDGRSNTRRFVYDAFGRVTRYTDASGQTSTRTYDPAGNIASFTDRSGATTTYAYDANDHLVRKTVPGTGTATYTYDPLGRVITAINGTATLSFSYDDAGNVLTAASTLPASTFTYSYDSANRRTSVTGPGGTTTYGFDDADRVSSVTDPAGGQFAMGYDPRGLLATMTRPNGVDDTRTYDGTGAITDISSRLGTSIVGEIGYAYDGAGRRSSSTNSAGTTTFGHDRAARLVSVDYPAAADIADQTFGYDPLGNRTSAAGVPAGVFAYDAGSRLLNDGTSDFTSDNEGNMLTRTVRATGASTSYRWSAEHELIGITYPDGTTATLRYDPFGRRVEIDDAGTVTRYAFDRDAIAAISDGAGSVVATFTRDGTDPTRALEMTRGNQHSFFLVDAIGSTVALTDAGGAVVGSYTYDAFGNATYTGTVESPFTFTGQLDAAHAGLLLFPARAYDPTLGRFISEDPLFDLNPYHYVFNDPVDEVDPTGRGTAEDATVREYSAGGDAAWRDLVRRALVNGEANEVRLVRSGVRTTYNLVSKFRGAAWDSFGPQFLY